MKYLLPNTFTKDLVTRAQSMLLSNHLVMLAVLLGITTFSWSNSFANIPTHNEGLKNSSELYHIGESGNISHKKSATAESALSRKKLEHRSTNWTVTKVELYDLFSAAFQEAGDDATICLPKTSLDLTDANSGYEWAAGAGNPAAATIDPSTGMVTGMTAVGNYTFTLTSTTDPADTDTITITVAEATEYTYCSGESIELYVQPGVSRVQWQIDRGTGFVDIPGATGLVLEVTEVGVYSYTALDSEECEAELCCPVTIIPGDCCVKPLGGIDVAVCLPATTVDLTDAGADEAWSVGTSNPATATINSSTGAVTGMTVAGVYEFILANTTTTETCADTVNVTVVTPPTPSVNSPTICEGSSAILTVMGCDGGIVRWSDASPLTIRTVNPTVTTTYSVTCSINDCVSDPVVATVTVVPKPDAGLDLSICEPELGVDLPNAAAGESWSFVSGPATASVDATSGLVTGMTDNGDYIFRLSASVADCDDEVMVTKKPQPQPTIEGQEICLGESATLTVESCNGTVLWTSGSTSMIRTVSPITTTTYAFVCTEDGCDSEEITAEVVVNESPEVTVIEPKVICDGTSVDLLATTDAVNPVFSWVGSALTSETVADPTATPAGSLQENKEYIYTVTVTDENGCSASAETKITVTPSLRVDAGVDQTVCEEGVASLVGTTNLVSSVLNGTVEVTWTEASGNPNSGSNLASTTGNAVQTNMLDIGEYVFVALATQTSPDGKTDCIISDEIKVTVLQQPDLTIEARNDNGVVTSICNDGVAEVTLAATLSADTPAAATITWSSVDDPSLSYLSCTSCDNPTLSVPENYTGATITYIASANVTGDNNIVCSNSASVTITVNQAAVLTAIDPLVICDGTSVQLDVNSDKSIVSYLWSGGPLDDPTIKQPTVSSTGSLQENTIYTYTVETTDANGCISDASTTVTVTPSIQLFAGSDQVVCENETPALVATTNLMTSTTNGDITVEWTESASNPNSGSNLASTSSHTVLTNALAPGEYLFTATVTQVSPDGSTPCVHQDEVKVTVTEAPVLSVSSTEPNICGSAQETITLEAVLSTPAAATYTWSSTDDPTLSFLSCASCDAPELTVPGTYTGTTITYSVKAVVTTDNNKLCETEAEITININPDLVITPIEDVTVCDEYISVTNTRTATLQDVNGLDVNITNWTITPMVGIANVSVSGANITFDVTPSNNQVEYTVLLESAENCTELTKFWAYETSRPIVGFTMDEFVCLESSVQVLFNGNAGPAANYTWDFAGATVIFSNDDNPYDGIAEGPGPHDIKWTTYPGFGNTYIVNLKVEDGGCESNRNESIRIERGYEVEWTSTDATTCNGTDGSISLVSALERNTNRDVANTLNFTWTSTNGFSYFAAYPDGANLTGLAPGTYSVRVENGIGGCDYEYDIDIHRPKNLGLNALVGYKATCGTADGGIHVEAVGGTAPYTFTYYDAGDNVITTKTVNDSIDYEWGLTEGKYSILVQDANGCTTDGEIILDNADGPRVEIANIVETPCGESLGEVEFTIFGAEPFSYQLYASQPYPGGTVTQSGIPIKLEFLAADDYVIEVTDANGCVTIKRFSVQSMAPNFNIAVTTIPGMCPFNPNGSTNELTGGFEVTSPIGAEYTYTWTGPDGTVLSPADAINPTGLANGNYTLHVSNGTCSDSTKLVINPIEGPTPEIVATTNPSCPDVSDGSVTFTVNRNPDTGQADINTFDLTNVGPFRYTLRNTTSQNGLVESGVIEQATDLLINGLEEGTYVLTITDRNECVGYESFTITDNPNFEILVDRENLEVCDANDGKISFTIIGAAGSSYEVAIDPDEIVPSPFVEGVETSIFGMSANTDYEITVTDMNGCIATFPANLTQPEVCFNCDLFAATDVESYNQSCDSTSDGEARVSVTGGTAPYTYTWYNSVGTEISTETVNDTFNIVEGLMNGMYYVEIEDANACNLGGFEQDLTAQISQSGGPEVTVISSTPATCGASDGNIRFEVDGVLDFDYILTPEGQETELATGEIISMPNAITISNLKEGRYVLSVTDGNGCTTTVVVDISSKEFPMEIASSLTQPSCDGSVLGEIEVSLTTKAGATTPSGNPVITWMGPDGSFSPVDQYHAELLPSGNYSVTVTYDNGCTETEMISLNAIDGPTLNTTVESDITCIGQEDGSFILNADGNGQEIIGYIVKGVRSVGYDAPYPTSITDEVVDGLAVGEYVVEVIGFNGCIGTTIVEINIPEELNILVDATPLDDCEVTNGSITVSMISGGVAPFTIKFKDSTSTFSVPQTWTSLDAGTYLLEVTDADGCMATFPVTIDDLRFEKCYGTIGDYVWKDVNNDGIQDAEENGVDDIKVILWSVSAGQPDAKIDSMLTYDGGMYLFDTLKAGEYIVQLDLSTIPDSCYVSDSTNIGTDDEVDSDFSSLTGFSPIVTLNPELGGINKDNPTIDGALFTPYGSIGDYVWKDENNDGIQDANEEGVEGVVLELWTAVAGVPDTKVEETMTSITGFYEFDSLLKGDYIVKIVDSSFPEACYVSDSTNKGNNDEVDNDFDPTSGLSPVVSLDPIKGGIDQDNPTIDGALFTPIGSIGDYVWKDSNNDGVQDTEEDGLNNVKVILWSADANGTPTAKLDSMLTDNGGMYEFDSLGKGYYLVQVDASSLPEECNLSEKQNFGGDDTEDSDVDPTSGFSQLVELDPIQGGILKDNPTIDAAVFTPYGSIGDYVWKDVIDNGAQDASEEGVEDVKVILWSANTNGEPEMKLDSMLTTATGFYEFDSLTKGDYLIQVVPTTIPEGCYITDKQDNSGDDTNDSDVDPTSGMSQVVTLDPIQGGILQDNPTIDAGLKQVLGSIGDYVWKDTNDDGIQDDSEVGVDGVVVNLWSADQSGNPISNLETTTTANGGMYLFDELPGGRYIVQIDKQTIPEECELSDKENAGGDDSKDSDFDPENGFSPVVTLDPILGGIDQDNLTIDAALVSPLGSLGDYVWKDANDDGIQDASEAGVENVVVNLWTADGSGNPLSQIATTTTSSTGYYNFSNLESGGYIVQIDLATLPVECELSDKVNEGGDDTKDSDFDPTSGLSPVVTINVNLPGLSTDNPTIDAGLKNTEACVLPVLTSGSIVCEGTSYSVSFLSSSANITSSAGTVSGSMITGIPLGVDVIITASEGVDCNTEISVTGPTTCPSNCTIPTLSVGQPICDGSTYSVSFTVSEGTISVSSGSVRGNTVIGIPVGTDVTITATDGDCEAKVKVTAPATCETEQCEDPKITLSAPVCSLQGDTYSVNFTLVDGASIVSSEGTVGDNIISGIPNGTMTIVTVSYPGCPNLALIVNAPVCDPELGSIGDYVWKDANDDGIQDADEAGVENVSLNLWTADASGNPVTQIASTVTSAGGMYQFTDLESGQYIVELVTSTLPEDCELSDKVNEGGDDTKDSDIDPTSGFSPVVTINVDLPGLSTDNPTIDAALVSTIVEVQPVDIELTKVVTDGNCTKEIGDIVSFEIVVSRKDGEAGLANIEVVDSLAGNFEFVSAVATMGDFDINTGTWTNIALEAGSEAKLTIEAKVLTSVGGLACNTAWVSSSDRTDVDSEAGNKLSTEDDYDMACVSVPITICSERNEKVELSSPAGYTTYQWMINGVAIENANSATYIAEAGGEYTVIVDGLEPCSTGNCCPIIVRDDCVCPPAICVPITIQKIR